MLIMTPVNPQKTSPVSWASPFQVNFEDEQKTISKI